MKVLIAIDSFKGSISSVKGSTAISLGIKDVYPKAEIITFPLADGGEGTAAALIQSTGGQLIRKKVTGPVKERIDAAYGILGDGKTAVIEIAAACGLPLVPPNKRNPLFTTTFGVGELILDAMNRGCREFIIGLGGSATNDAGVGMLQALGFSFLNRFNEEISFGGKELKNIKKIVNTNAIPELKECLFKVACDVNNPLYGRNGAAYVFGPQKGATEEIIKELDYGLENFARVVLDQLNIDIHHLAGAGAAGGLGAAFAGLLNGQLESGITLILDSIKMEKELVDTDLVITGEGKLDSQTSMGKVPLGVAKLAKKYNVPVLALAGTIEEGLEELNEIGITSYFSIINAPMTLEKAMDENTAHTNLMLTTKQIFQLIKACKEF